MPEVIRAPFRAIIRPISEALLKDWYSNLRMESYSDIETFPHSKSLVFAFLKRMMDISVSGVLLIALLPLFLLISLLIRATSPGPSLILQKRVGERGRIFTMYKFRTMYKSAELYEHSPVLYMDTRVTTLGRILRRTSLDELPQLYNVFLGTMSLIGPRPEMPFIVDTYKPWQKIRLLVKPGLSGMWQICGRKDRPLLENIEYDLYYIEHQSLFLDIAIMVRTIPTLIWGIGAY